MDRRAEPSRAATLPGWCPQPSLTLRDLARARQFTGAIHAQGPSQRAALAQAELLSICATILILRGEGGENAARAFVVPGRIEVLGKHTDYCGGRSLLMAMEQGMAFVAVRSSGPGVEFIDALRGESTSFGMSPSLEPVRGSWPLYPMTVARRIARNFPGTPRGVRVAFATNLPPAAGMSSSSVLITGSFLSLASINELDAREDFRAHFHNSESLPSYLAAVENGSSFGALAGDTGVGTQGGSEDHTAILRCQPGRLSVYSFAPVRLERHLCAPPEMVFAVASSGIVAEKTGAALERYNLASRLARAVVDVWNHDVGASDPNLAAVVVRLEGDVDRIRAVLEKGRHPEFSPTELLDRLDHFYEESYRILPRAATLLEQGSARDFGEWVDRSQELGTRLLKNQVPETVHLARDARRLGAHAASAFGAGFGGSVWALVRSSEAGSFTNRWRAAYTKAFPTAAERSVFLTTEASAAAFEVRG